MEYATKIENSSTYTAPSSCGGGVVCNDDYTRYVGYREKGTYSHIFFSKQTVDTISNKVTNLLMGVDPQGRPIIVPDKTICSVMSEIYSTTIPRLGKMYAQNNIPLGFQDNYIQEMISQVIEIITTQVRNTLLMVEQNSKLTKWTTVMGDFNAHNLRQHPPIKIRHKRPNPMQFNMKY